jgi:glycosyltransferase involved in cell wall biosynthesis
MFVSAVGEWAGAGLCFRRRADINARQFTMRFLMLNWRDPFSPIAGGAERVTQAHLAELARRGHEVFWFANAYPGLRESDTLDGVHIIRGGGKGTSILAARKWYRTQPRFDLVIDQHHGIPWYAPWWCGTNCIAYIHEVLGPIWGSFYPWPLSTLGRWQEYLTHRMYRRVPFWTVSESTAQQLREVGVESVHVWPNGTDTTALPALEPKPLETPLRLVVVSRLARNKRIEHCLRAVRCLRDRGTAVHLTIIGTGETETELKALTASLDLQSLVTFTGKLGEAEKNAQLRRAHALLHTSVREGWGLNVVEANAMGTPAVVYPVGGLVDSTVNGVTGMVVETETPEALAAGVTQLASSAGRYDAMRQKAWERARAHEWSKILPPTCDWLEDMARRKK